MYKINTLFACLLLVVLLVSCKERQVVHDAQHHVILNVPSLDIRSISERDIIQIETFANSVSHIKLETTDESLIGQISKILFFDSLLIIQDRQTHSVLVFDRNGKFINTIGKRGQGPGEFASLRRVLLDADSRQIMVFDAAGRKMIHYDFYGNFIREVTNFAEGTVIRDIINLPNGHFLCYNFDQYPNHRFSGLWEVDSYGVYVRTHLPPNTGYPFIENRYNSYLFYLNDGVGLSAGDVDVIYHFRQGTLSAFLAYTIGNRTSVEDVRRGNMRENRNRIETFEYVRRGVTHEKGNYIFTEWASGGDGHIRFMSVFSKRDNDIIAVGLPTFHSSRLATFGNNIVPSNDVSSLVTVVDASQISLYLENPDMSSELARNKLLELTYGMSEREIEDMNPIIQILHIRQ